jgi:hypothetical protein
MQAIRRRISSAHLIALLALFVALSGSAYAIHLGKNAVKTRNIKNSAITEAKLAPGSVTAGKLGVGAVDANALGAGAVDASALGAIVVRSKVVSVPDGGDALPVAACLPGERAISGGGLTFQQGTSDIKFDSLRPVTSDGSNVPDGQVASAWMAEYTNVSGGTGTANVAAYALCMR